MNYEVYRDNYYKLIIDYLPDEIKYSLYKYGSTLYNELIYETTSKSAFDIQLGLLGLRLSDFIHIYTYNNGLTKYYETNNMA